MKKQTVTDKWKWKYRFVEGRITILVYEIKVGLIKHVVNSLVTTKVKLSDTQSASPSHSCVTCGCGALSVSWYWAGSGAYAEWLDHTSSTIDRYLPGTKVHCLVTETQGCEQFTKGVTHQCHDRKSNPSLSVAISTAYLSCTTQL